jgi:two-component system nitrogen regulation sensor histidine kinase NtrY
VALGTLPLAAALLALAFYVRSGSPVGPRAAIDEIAASGRGMVTALDTTRLDSTARAAVRGHIESIARRTTLARRADRLSRAEAAALGAVGLVLAVLVVGLSIVMVRRWSAQVSAPIEELVAWVRGIEAGRAPPAADAAAGAGPPELDMLRAALRQMAAALEAAREREVERERLQAFRDTARRVAHEMRGPLNAAQLALGRLTSTEGDARHGTALAVLREETERLRRMADEFALFGRLPEGAESEIDLGEMVAGVLTAAVPSQCPVLRHIEPGLRVRGRYEVLRRAVENVVRNAVEVTDARGIAVHATRADGVVRLVVADHGPGVPTADRDRIFQPYVTTKSKGTGLGLAIARQAAGAHGGTLVVGDDAGGGAAFTFTLPAA